MQWCKEHHFLSHHNYNDTCAFVVILGQYHIENGKPHISDGLHQSTPTFLKIYQWEPSTFIVLLLAYELAPCFEWFPTKGNQSKKLIVGVVEQILLSFIDDIED